MIKIQMVKKALLSNGPLRIWASYLFLFGVYAWIIVSLLAKAKEGVSARHSIDARWVLLEVIIYLLICNVLIRKELGKRVVNIFSIILILVVFTIWGCGTLLYILSQI